MTKKYNAIIDKKKFYIDYAYPNLLFVDIFKTSSFKYYTRVTSIPNQKTTIL